MSHQQLRSYGDGTSVLSIIRKTGEARVSNTRPLVYKASRLTATPQRLLESDVVFTTRNFVTVVICFTVFH